MKQNTLFIPIKKKSDINQVFEQGLKLYSGNLLLRYVQGKKETTSLPISVLMALPKKKLGAVKRNRLRRICKSALFQAMKNLYQVLTADLKQSCLIVIHAKESFEDLSEFDRILEFENLLKRLIKQQ